jgi:hypothetical protein
VRALSLAICLACAGCLAGLDERPLTSGFDMARPVDLALPLVLDGGVLPCDDFASDPVGPIAAGWSSLVGIWTVVPFGAGHSLGQQGLPGGLSIATEGGAGWRDLTVNATVENAAGALDCVLARVQDQDNYYALCLLQRTEWSITTRVGGISYTALSGTRASNQAEAMLSLDVTGPTLAAMIDGSAVGTATDSRLDHGLVGIATQGASVFPQVCVNLR